MSRMPRRDGNKPKRALLKNEDIVSLFNSGTKINEIAGILGVTRNAISYRLIKLGLKKRFEKKLLSKERYCAMLGEMEAPKHMDVPLHASRWAILFREKHRAKFNESYENYLKTGEMNV